MAAKKADGKHCRWRTAKRSISADDRQVLDPARGQCWYAGEVNYVTDIGRLIQTPLPDPCPQWIALECAPGRCAVPMDTNLAYQDVNAPGLDSDGSAMTWREYGSGFKLRVPKP